MTTGRSNIAGSDTRRMVSWNVECGPTRPRNCFGRPSRDAGHNRVPAPPHMINGMMRSVIGPFYSFHVTGLDASQFMEVAIPLHEPRDAVLDRRRRPETDLAHEIIHIGV